MGEWLMSQNPAWIFIIFPLLFGTAFCCFLFDQRQKAKKRANPHTMDEDEYQDFNRERFRR